MTQQTKIDPAPPTTPIPVPPAPPTTPIPAQPEPPTTPIPARPEPRPETESVLGDMPNERAGTS